MSAYTSDCIELEVIRLLAASGSTEVCSAMRSVSCFDDYIKACNIPLATASPNVFSRDLLLCSFLKKWECGGDPENRAKATIDSWQTAERQCYETTYRINRVEAFPCIKGILERARDWCAYVLGDCFETRISSRGRWSNGATYDTRRGVHRSLKMVGTKSVTSLGSLCVPYFFKGFGEAAFNAFEVVDGNKCVQVPKSWKINRMISAEPAANAFMQQAVGQYIRKRLLAVGVDLTDQTNNQMGAFHALVDGLATVDLSMASDTIAVGLVDYLLPPQWFGLLDQLRSHKTKMDGKWYYLNKFSSMGNAFTFELETLIFWSLCKSLGATAPLVYGDDIIIEQRLYEPLTALLSFCGLTVNKDKSFSAGSRFFESCGKQYFDLEDVTPAYQKEPVVGDASIMRCHNRLSRWAERNDAYDVVKTSLRYLRSRASDAARACKIPPCERDDGFITRPSHLKVDANGDFRCFVLADTRTSYSRKGVDEYASYRLKLHNEAITNEDPRGYPSCVITRPAASVRRATVWRSAMSLVQSGS